MKLIHCLVGVLIYLLVAAGIFVVYGLFAADTEWDQLFLFLYQQETLTIGGLIGSFFLMLLFALTKTRRSIPVDFITYSGDGGAVSISVKAVKDFIQKVGQEFAAIVGLQPSISVYRGRVEVDLDVRVSGGTHVPELCELLQQRVRESLRDDLGLSAIRAVRINVREIAGLNPGSREEESEDGV